MVDWFIISYHIILRHSPLQKSISYPLSLSASLSLSFCFSLYFSLSLSFSLSLTFSLSLLSFLMSLSLSLSISLTYFSFSSIFFLLFLFLRRMRMRIKLLPSLPFKYVRINNCSHYLHFINESYQRQPFFFFLCSKLLNFANFIHIIRSVENSDNHSVLH